VINVRDNEPLRGFEKIERRKVFEGSHAREGEGREAEKISGASQFFSNREEISIYIIFKDR
jgi:hypothetical protein